MGERGEHILHDRARILVATLTAVTDRPVTAVEAAAAMGLKRGRESQRRRVREAAKYARENLGHRVCAGAGASVDCGYWLARTAAEWAEYLETQRTGARFKFAALARTQRAVTDAMNQQRRLFG